MMALRTALSLVLVGFILASWSPRLYAAIDITTSWERPVTFKVVDVDSAAALSQPLLIIKKVKLAEGIAEPIIFYEVLTGSTAGLVDYLVEVKSEGVEVMSIVPGYGLSNRKVFWNELPPRELDGFGSEKKVPTITLALKPLPKASDWKREFRLVIVPELEELILLKPPQLSKQGHRAINEFLNRERNPALGF
ncbi:hypothetical protein ACFLZU_01945 [Thermodesulfobacteriota bacterium]|jgi:hypothetical protein